MKMDSRDLLLASLEKQYLLEPATMAEVASNLCGLQAQFANNPAHALRIRAHDFSPDRWRDGLIKTWTFRHTLHAIPEREHGLYLSSLGKPAAWDNSWGVDAAIKPRAAKALARWIRNGIGDRRELKQRCKMLGIADETVANIFHGWGGLLKEMCQRGMCAYTPGTEKRFVPAGQVRRVSQNKARSILLERYFRFLGPATLTDCAVFTGYKRASIHEILKKSKLPLQRIECDGQEYWHLGNLRMRRSLPRCLFLAGFDQLILAYKDRSRLVDDKHCDKIVTNTGIIHPTVLLDGKLMAKWKLAGSTLTVTRFASLSRQQRACISQSGEELFGDSVKRVVFAGE
ncbi:MAG: winged helix DNA-binding domain-containing protein [Planctomycetes bacterium]|nr:winged helix DNA-binding domain-containing protein [Planctomycetota bacterium]